MIALRYLLLTGVFLTACEDAQPPAEMLQAKASAARADGLCEHGVLDAICPKCHPAVAAVFKAKGDWCEEHGFPESVCPTCHPERKGRPGREVGTDEAPADGTKINLRTQEAVSIAGIETVTANRTERVPRAEALVRIQYDATKVALVSAPTAGVVRKLSVDVGTKVKRGALLAVIDSVGVGADRSALVAAEAKRRAAEANLVRERELQAEGVSPQRDVERAQSERDSAVAAVQRARAALGVVGAAEKGAGAYTIHAPLGGVITRRLTSIGQSLGAGAVAFEIVDASSMWADIEVPEQDLGRVHAGQATEIHVDALKGRSFDGQISFIAPAVDPRTRTALARVPLTNDDGALRANMFGRAFIELGLAENAVTVPVASVQRAEGQAFVFVRTGEASFEARRVTIGNSDDKVAEVRGGLKAGEVVATTGAFLLKTEVLKGAIGAGCCE